MVDLATAVSGIALSMQALKVAIAARDEAKINAAISDLKDRLFDVQSANLQALENLHKAQAQVHTLMEDNKKLSRQIDERGFYFLDNITKDRGSQLWAYCYKVGSNPSHSDSAPAHYLCQPCFDKDTKSVLYLRNGLATCNVCKVVARYANPEVDSLGQPAP